MTNLSKNFFYNILLTVSGYIFPLLTFPYTTRVLGAEGLGYANFALSIIDYAVLFSTLGITTIGTKEIAKCNNDTEKLNSVFSSLLSLHILFMLVVAVIYFTIVALVPELSTNYKLYFIGFIKISCNVFLVEWLFSGLQNFQYITLRSIFTRILYVIAIFAFIHSPEDYWIYVLVTVLQVFLNAAINWRFSQNFIKFTFVPGTIKEYIWPVISLGANSIMLSFYSTFIIMYLGFACDKDTVGYYTVSTKLYAIILSIISAFNGVLVPYLNSLYGSGNIEAMKQTIEKSIGLVVFLSVPVVTFCCITADDIVLLIAGEGFARSVFPFQIVIVQVILVGLSQITELQVLLTLDKIKTILSITFVTALGTVIIMLLYGRQYAEVAAAYAVMVPHVVECLLLYYFAHKYIKFSFPLKSTIRYIILSVIMFFIFSLAKDLFEDNILTLLFSFIVSAIIYILPLYFMNDSGLILVLNKLIAFVPKKNKS